MRVQRYSLFHYLQVFTAKNVLLSKKWITFALSKQQDRNVAQLVAHYVRDVGVGRSSRLIPTIAQKLNIQKTSFCSYLQQTFDFLQAFCTQFWLIQKLQLAGVFKIPLAAFFKNRQGIGLAMVVTDFYRNVLQGLVVAEKIGNLF